MATTVQAIYQDGALRPLEPLELAEGTRVEVTVTALQLDDEASEARRAEEMLKAIAALPLEAEGHFSNRDHDRALYGEQDRP